MKHLIKPMTVAAAVSLLMISCANQRTNHGTLASESTPLTSSTSVYTAGAGNRPAFQANEALTAAPRDQTYYFAYDHSQITNNAYITAIQAQAQYLIKHPHAKVLLTGHTDQRGSREYNIALGERRAKRVAEILSMAGVNNTQIRVLSYGKERLAVNGEGESVWRLNRRVELSYEVLS